jgi:ubiquinone/menaquinone biosynthesis C-methylase UbiE
MNLATKIRDGLASTSFFAFNQVWRDRWVAKQAVSLKPGSRVLDIGAGSCPYRALFSHCEYRAQDFTMLENAQLRYGGYGTIDYVCDIQSIPAQDASFDVIICTEVLEHLPEPIKAVREMARLLRPQGKLILTAPLGSGVHQEPYHFYGGYTPYWYERFLHEAGFDEIDVEPNGGFFRLYGQESLRFLRMTRPLAAGMPSWLTLTIAPLWILSAPFLGLFVPVICSILDRFDSEQRFTVGYHVTAKRSR